MPRVPGSGRKPGVKPVFGKDVKAAILAGGKPLQTLFAVANGRKVRAADPHNPKRCIFLYPTLETRINAARTLLAKCVPDVKATEVSGPDGAPIQTEDLSAEARAIGDLDLASKPRLKALQRPTAAGRPVT